MLLSHTNNFKVYNMDYRINIYLLRPDFSRIGNKPFIASFKKTCEPKNKLALVSSNFNGLSSRSAEDMLLRSVVFVMENKDIDYIQIEMKRFECFPSFPIQKSVTRNTMGVMCFGRENALGGILETVNLTRELAPFELVVFPEVLDANMTQLQTADDSREGYTDFVFYTKYEN